MAAAKEATTRNRRDRRLTFTVLFSAIMDSSFFKKHAVTECNCCGHLMVVEIVEQSEQRGDTMNLLSDAYADHLDESAPCREWHDALPTLDDLRGVDITGGVESSEYVRRLREDW